MSAPACVLILGAKPVGRDEIPTLTDEIPTLRVGLAQGPNPPSLPAL